MVNDNLWFRGQGLVFLSFFFFLRPLRQNLAQAGDQQASLAFREKPFSLLTTGNQSTEWPRNLV